MAGYTKADMQAIFVKGVYHGTNFDPFTPLRAKEAH